MCCVPYEDGKAGERNTNTYKERLKHSNQIKVKQKDKKRRCKRSRCVLLYLSATKHITSELQFSEDRVEISSKAVAFDELKTCQKWQNPAGIKS